MPVSQPRKVCSVAQGATGGDAAGAEQWLQRHAGAGEEELAETTLQLRTAMSHSARLAADLATERAQHAVLQKAVQMSPSSC